MIPTTASTTPRTVTTTRAATIRTRAKTSGTTTTTTRITTTTTTVTTTTAEATTMSASTTEKSRFRSPPRKPKTSQNVLNDQQSPQFESRYQLEQVSTQIFETRPALIFAISILSMSDFAKGLEFSRMTEEVVSNLF